MLQQHTDLARFSVDSSFFNQFWGDKKGDWGNIFPHELVHSIKVMKRSATNVTMYETAENRRWGNPTQNNVAKVFLDNAFHFSGYNNGVFSDFISPFNDVLEENSDLTGEKKTTLQRRVMNAVTLGLREAGAAYADQFTSNSHLDPFPQDGHSLLSPNSMAARELANIQANVEKPENKSFWEEDEELEELKQEVAELRKGHPSCPTMHCLYLY